ncbi:MAG TPA: Uma2 family endonuclease [Pirellulales bacterium]|nr:Uma2 family endonuclease [Pirellulales bacterium]
MAIVTEQRVPPLMAGDKLTRDEFLRRWGAEPGIKLAELIGGTVYMPSPVSVEHGGTDGDVGGWLSTYKAFTPGTASERNSTAFMLGDTPQPDLNLRLLPEYGGGSWVEGKYLHGAPELVAEVCASSASYDLHQKYDLYEAAGILEYLAVVVFEQEIRWHALVDGRYQLLSPDVDGLWRSRIFPGLWLDGQALLAGKLRQVLDRLQEGLRSAEHERFVGELAARRKA